MTINKFKVVSETQLKSFNQNFKKLEFTFDQNFNYLKTHIEEIAK